MTNDSFGKIHPQAIDLEEVVLGAFMIDVDSLDSVPDVKKHYFYNDRHLMIFEAIEKLVNQNSKVDILTVTEMLRKMGKLDEVGGPYYITQLTNRVATAAHIDDHIKIIKQKFFQRELVRIGMYMTRMGYDETEDVFESVDKAKKEVDKIIDNSTVVEVKTVLKETIKLMQEPDANDKPEFPGIGIKSYDQTVQSYHGNLHLIAGRPGMGKTAFAMHKAKVEAVKHRRPILIFSYEMTARDLTARLLAESGVSYRKIISKRFDANGTMLLLKSAKQYEIAPIFIIDDPTIEIKRLMLITRKMVKSEGIEKLYADHLKLIPIRGITDIYAATSEKSRLMKVLAKEEDIPVELLCQLSRKCEERGGLMKPMISDLRDSGAIEENADSITMLWRPEYYYSQGKSKFATVKTAMGDTVCSAGYVEAIVGKNRNGAPGTAMMSFDAPRFMFTDFHVRTKHDFEPNFEEEDDSNLGF